MYKCSKCKEKFVFPRVIKPDAGFSNPTGIIHRHVIDSVKMCPECGSTHIEVERKCG